MLRLPHLRDLCILKQIHHLYYNQVVPVSIQQLFMRNSEIHHYETRQRANPKFMKPNYNVGRNSFMYIGPKLWSNLCAKIQGVETVRVFVKSYKQYILAQYLQY